MLSDAERSWNALRDAVLAELRAGHGRVDLGVGGLCEYPSDFPRSYREAQLALRIQRAIGSNQPIMSFDQLGIYSVLAEVEDTAAVERFTRDWLGALLEYDAERNADLVTTLSSYLERGGNSANTATALSVHRNTLKYRLQRVARSRATIWAIRTPCSTCSLPCVSGGCSVPCAGMRRPGRLLIDARA